MKVWFLGLIVFIVILPVIAGGEQGEHHHAVLSGSNDVDNHSHVKSGVGKPALAADASQTFSVTMLDTMRFEFDKPLMIKRGDIVRFIVSNKGKIRHEFSIGNVAEQQQHAETMREMPGMIHKDGNTLSLSSGESGEITWHFEGDDEVVFACNISGHSEAGMLENLILK